jgi:predicted transcriptional regulator
MVNPDGSLTPAQHEILEAIWNGPAGGLTVTEIWHVINMQRKITRTTVLNQVDRLEKRNWLRRKKCEDGYRYLATRSREETTQALAEEFVDGFFRGSASELVMCLFGSRKLKPADIARLRNILDSKFPNRNSKP